MIRDSALLSQLIVCDIKERGCATVWLPQRQLLMSVSTRRVTMYYLILKINVYGDNFFHYPKALFKPVVMKKLSESIHELCYTILS